MDLKIIKDIFKTRKSLSKFFAPDSYLNCLYFNFYNPYIYEKLFYVVELKTIVVFEDILPMIQSIINETDVNKVIVCSPKDYLSPIIKVLSIIKDKKDGKLILVTAINPTPLGEGKTTMSIGLADGLKCIGKKSILALREPSLGLVFGMNIWSILQKSYKKRGLPMKPPLFLSNEPFLEISYGQYA